MMQRQKGRLGHGERHGASRCELAWRFLPTASAVSLTLLVLLSTSLCATEVPQEVRDAQRQRIETIKKISSSTVAVFGLDDSAGGGSAVVITPDGYALTNFHVTKPVGNHLKCGMNDGVFYDAVIVGIDPTGDVALIKLLGRDDFPHADIGDSDLVRAGDWCIVSGNPFLLATDFKPTVTYGIVSGVHRYQYPSGTLLEYADCIQTDASINPGNSGGPMWNTNGELIGINGRGSFEKRGRVNVGVGYAISINQIKKFMGYLRSGRIVDHATFGATVSTDIDGRVVITNILDSSDAYRRGLRYGDEVVSFAGRTITSANDFKNMLGTLPKGWRVLVTFVRDGEKFETRVRLAGVHRSEELLAKLQLGGQVPPNPRPPQPGPRPIPGPDDESPDREEEDENPDQPKLPVPKVPMFGKRESKKLDPKIAKLFKEKRGYSNFYFNEIKQESIWEKLTKPVDAESKKKGWMISGNIDGGKPFELVVSDELVGGRVNGVFEELDFGKELSPQRSPRNSGGLLLALHQWRRFLLEGPKKFGDLYYLGTAPLYSPDSSEPEQTDVLVGTFNVLENRFYFDRNSGTLDALETYPDSEVDPCELHFKNYGKVGDYELPAAIDVVFGDKKYGTLTIDAFKLVDVEEAIE